MKIRLAFSAVAALLLLAACGQTKTDDDAASTAAAAGCDRSATQVVAFTAPDAQDLIEAHSYGPDCGNAVVMITIRRADGVPLYAWATARPWVADRTVSATNGEEMQNFLQHWAQANVDTTLAMPDWPQRQTAFADQLGPFMSTPLPREQYLDVRSKGAPRLCFSTGIDSGTCIAYDAQSATAAKVLETGS